MELELTEIKQIIALFERSDLAELDLKNNGQRLRLKKPAEPQSIIRRRQEVLRTPQVNLKRSVQGR